MQLQEAAKCLTHYTSSTLSPWNYAATHTVGYFEHCDADEGADDAAVLVKLSHNLAHSVRGNGKRDAVCCYSLKST